MYLKSAQQFDDTCFSHLYKDRRTPLFYVTLKSKACRKIIFFSEISAWHLSEPLYFSWEKYYSLEKLTAMLGMG